MSLSIWVTLGGALDPNDTEEVTLHVKNTSNPHRKYCKVHIEDITLDTTVITIAHTIPTEIPDVHLTDTQLNEINDGPETTMHLCAIKTGTTNDDGTLNEATIGVAHLNVTVKSSISECIDQVDATLPIGSINVTQ